MKKCALIIIIYCIGILALGAMEDEGSLGFPPYSSRGSHSSRVGVQTGFGDEVFDVEFLEQIQALEDSYNAQKSAEKLKNASERSPSDKLQSAQKQHKRLRRRLESSYKEDSPPDQQQKSVAPRKKKHKKRGSHKRKETVEEDEILSLSFELSDEIPETSSLKKKRLRRKAEDLPVEEMLDEDDLFSDEVEKREVKRKTTKKSKKKKKRPKFSGRKFLGLEEEDERPKRVMGTTPIPGSKDESDEEEEGDLGSTYKVQELPANLNSVIETGTQLKLLANVYLGKIDEMANIFFPQFELSVKQRDGSVKGVVDYFRTPKGEICVFASGGIQNAWEKTVARVHEIFFGQKVKIIRQGWIQKHFQKDKKMRIDIAKEFKGREHELHSEYYYDLFFEHFFLPQVQSLGLSNGGRAERLSINGFSWWEVCNRCNDILTRHKSLCEEVGVELVRYNIAATRRYRHSYTEDSLIAGTRVPGRQENLAWQSIWAAVQRYAVKEFDGEAEKKKFWTKTVEGLELCKWLGQAFEENLHNLMGRSEKPGKKGDILRFYSEVTEEDAAPLKNLLVYLREKNWEFSCWYKPRYPNKIMGNWKKYWLQVVMPHFNWKVVAEFDDESRDNICEMCGNEDVFHMFWVYHPKFRVTQKFLDLPEEQQEQTERDLGFDLDTPFDQLPPHLQRERRQSLTVGSECVKFLGIDRAEVREWREEHPEKELEARLEYLDTRQAQNEEIDEVQARTLLNWMREAAVSQSPLKKRYITRNSDWDTAKELNPLLDILVRDKKIQEVEKGSFIVLEK